MMHLRMPIERTEKNLGSPAKASQTLLRWCYESFKFAGQRSGRPSLACGLLIARAMGEGGARGHWAWYLVFLCPVPLHVPISRHALSSPAECAGDGGGDIVRKLMTHKPDRNVFSKKDESLGMERHVDKPRLTVPHVES